MQNSFLQTRNSRLLAKVHSYEAHTASVKKLRDERDQAESRQQLTKEQAEKFRRGLQTAKKKIVSDGHEHEATANKLRNVTAANNILQAKLNSFQTRNESIRELRQERLDADARADAAEIRYDEVRLELKTVQTKLQQALRRSPASLRARVFA